MTPLRLDVMPSGGKDLHRQVPDATVDSHVLCNSRDRTGPNEPPSGCSTPQPPAKQIFLNSIRDPPEIVPNVLRPPAGEKLRRLEPALGSFRESQLKCALGKLKLLILRESPMLHVLNLRGQTLESLSHLKSANDDLVDDIAPMAHTLRREGASRDDQTVRANDPKDSDAQLIGARPVVAIQEQDLQHGIIELHGLKPPPEPHDMPCVQWAL